MPRLYRLTLVLLLAALSACSFLSEKADPAPAPAPPPAVPEPNPELEPGRKIILPVAIPHQKPRHTSPTRKKTKITESKPIAEAPASISTPAAAPPEATKPIVPVLSTKPRKSINGPAWLQYCSDRQQSPTGILCDANTLLAKPSNKVQVYVREAALARDTPTGRIRLREGLPRLYRFFVIP